MEAPRPLGYGESAQRAGGRVQEAGSRLWRQAKQLLPSFRDLHVYVGTGLVAWGAWTAWEPLGFVVGGAVLLYLGLKGV